MKTRFLVALMAITIVGTMSMTTAQAEEAPAMPAHTGMGSHAGMMKGHMDMGQMQGMMKDCMSKNNDHKMCDQEAMQSCQKDMKKGDCQKMMRAAKKATK